MNEDLINPERDDEGKPVWSVSGYLDLDGEYYDWSNEDFTNKGDDWYSDADLVTINWVDADTGEMQFARLVGPFEDYEDLENIVDTYFEEGSE